jgi:hypothetical protein
MDLRTFVAETLKQIVEGIGQANRQGARTIPGSSNEVEFDVALTVTEGSDKKGGIGVLVGGFGIGGQGSTTATNSSVSRIKFTVTMEFPGS